MACTCEQPPALTLEIARIKALGAQYLGICGDANHTSGFHLPSCRLPNSDYSLRYGRGNPNYAAALDVGMAWAASRQWLAWLVAEAKAGRKPGLVEIIGSINGSTVLYWAQWNSWKPQVYTGADHVTHSHLGCNRTTLATARDLRLLAWTPPKPVDWTKEMIMALPTLKEGAGMTGSPNEDVDTAQALLNARGRRTSIDGRFGPATTSQVKGFQTSRKITADGIIGPITWHHLLNQQALL